MSHKLTVIGIGPGAYDMMTGQAVKALQECDVIVGYQVYTELVREYFPEKEYLTTPMRREEERCRLAFAEASKGKNTAMVCSGDAGVYGMAGLIWELSAEYPGVEIEIQPGITAACSGAACLGAPLIHDFAVISLSDLMTPWEKIKKRLHAAAEADFSIVLYNPSSHKRKDYLEKACEILLQSLPQETVCGTVENIGREGTKVCTCTLGELKTIQVNMFTTVFIGNGSTKLINGKMVTPRGYHLEENT